MCDGWEESVKTFAAMAELSKQTCCWKTVEWVIGEHGLWGHKSGLKVLTLLGLSTLGPYVNCIRALCLILYCRISRNKTLIYFVTN